MGAFLAFQPAAGHAAISGAARAQEQVERAKGLAIAEACPEFVKFHRRDGSGALPARSERGWLLSVGGWHHPDCGVDDNAALLRLLETRGETELDRLDGFYVVVWNDGARGEWLVQPDHFGRLHVYAAETNEGLLLGTSPIALARALRAPPDPLALAEFLSAGTLFEERTHFRGMRRLQGARRYRYVAGRCMGADDIPRQVVPAAGVADRGAGPDEFLSAARSSVNAFLPEGLRLLPDLTGGLDSRLVVGLMQSAGRKFDVTVTGDATDPDVRVAALLARRVGLNLIHEPRSRGLAAQSSFDRVLAAAARVDGEYDAIEYAAIAAIHEPHSEGGGRSVNGSGGEVLRNYWWSARHLGRCESDAASDAVSATVEELLRRFTHALQPQELLASPLDPAAHFRDVLRRTLAARAGDPLPTLFDHAYLHLRMQCWQGAIASATNEIWANISPLLLRGPLEALYRIPARERLGGALIRQLLARFPAPYRTTPLETGFPPLPHRLRHAARFLPGLARLPLQLARRAHRKFFPKSSDPVSCGVVRDLMRGGAGEWLEPRTLVLRPFLDAKAFDSWLERARTTGEVPLPQLGRLVAAEYAARAAIQE